MEMTHIVVAIVLVCGVAVFVDLYLVLMEERERKAKDSEQNQK